MNYVLTLILKISLLLLVLGVQNPVRGSETTEKPIGILLAAGDITNCYSSIQKYKEVAKLLGKHIDISKKEKIPVKILALGDLAYGKYKKGGELVKNNGECFDAFKASWGIYKEHIIPVPGNHDYSDDKLPNEITDKSIKAENFFRNFKDFYSDLADLAEKKPSAAFVSSKGSFILSFPEEHEHSWLLAGFNFYGGREQEAELLEDQFKKSDRKCIIAISHPFFNSSGHHGRKLKNHTYEKMRPFFKMLVDVKATALVAAHDHHFEQFKGQNTTGEESDDGVRQFIVGTGGSKLYLKVSKDKRQLELDKPKHPLSEGELGRDSHGILRISLFPNKYQWSFEPIEGDPPIKLETHEDSCNR